MNCFCDRILLTELPNQFNVDVMKSLILTRYSLGENVVNEPVQVDCGLLPLLLGHLLLVPVFGSMLSDCYQVFQLL